ncbi:thyrotropin-releasing hormone-degrading ectoenzyme-like isoform X3 [Ornithodoros turicata]|uniref:thyrotropin-releasing hormone-degrading ectoenzyme-like isoform X2 n=1 Tax=Ornithodoros turicata TaxID=34597 RepID=UPI003138F7FB
MIDSSHTKISRQLLHLLFTSLVFSTEDIFAMTDTSGQDIVSEDYQELSVRASSTPYNGDPQSSATPEEIPNRRTLKYMPSTPHPNRRVQTYRLPRHVYPVNYTLHISVNKDISSEHFEGQVRMLLRCTESTRILHFHASPDMKLGDMSVETAINFGFYEVNIRKVTREDDVVSLRLDERLECDTYHVLTVYFTMNFVSKYGIGFYKDSMESSKLLVTFFEPNGARNAFPCLDEPKMKASFIISVLHPAFLTARSNMPLESSTESANGMVLDTFQQSPMMSTYTVGWALTDYRNTTKGRVTIWDDRSRGEEEVHNSLDLFCRALDYFEDFIGINYTLPKLDVIAVKAQRYNAMENWGMVTVRDSYLFHPSVSVIVHEVAHQWFGNMMTMTWWNDIWVQEAPAYYFGIMGAQLLVPEVDYMSELVLNLFTEETFHDSRPTLFSEHTFHGEQVNEDLRAALEYSFKTRPYYLLRMIHFLLGNEEFRATLAGVVMEYNGKTLNGYEFLVSMTAEQRRQPPVDIFTHMLPWYESDGIPELLFQRNYGNNTVTVSQKPHKNSKPHVYHIPMVYNDNRTQNIFEPLRYDEIIWLTTEQGIIEDGRNDETAILLNPGMIGYFVINYDDRNWALVGQYLTANPQMADPFLLRQLYYSANIFYERNEASVESFLWLWEYFSTVSDLEVWSEIEYDFNKKDMYLIGFKFGKQYNARLVQIWNSTGQTLNFNSFKISAMRDDIENYAKKALCTMDYGPCVRTMLALWRKSGSKFNKLTPFIRWSISNGVNPESILCVVVRHGGKKIVTKITRWMKDRSASKMERTLAAHALMYSRNNSIVRTAIRHAIFTDLRWYGSGNINRYTYRVQRIILDVFFQLLSEDTRCGTNNLKVTAWYIRTYMETDTDVQKYERLLREKFPTLEKEVTRMVEEARRTLQQKERDYPAFKRWLHRELPPLR